MALHAVGAVLHEVVENYTDWLESGLPRAFERVVGLGARSLVF